MARMTIVVDTEDKTFDVKVDGTTVDGAVSASAYVYRDSKGEISGVDGRVEVSSKSGMNNDVAVWTTYYIYGSQSVKDNPSKSVLILSETNPRLSSALGSLLQR